MIIKLMIVIIESLTTLIGGHMLLVLNNTDNFKWSIWAIASILFGIGLIKSIHMLDLICTFCKFTYHTIKLKKLLKKGGNTL